MITRPGITPVAALAGIDLLYTAATRFCGLDAVLGIDTCPRDESPGD